MKLVDYDIDLEKISIDCNICIIGSAGLGYNAPQIVDLNGVRGFLKKSDNSTNTFDKFEYLLSKLGKFLKIKTADEYLVDTGEGYNLFSKSVVDDGEELIMASSLYEELVKSGLMTKEEAKMQKEQISEFNKSLEVVKYDKGHELKVSNDQIDFVVNSFIDKLKKFKLSNEEEIIKDYIKMCFFDSLIGNKDRNANNYGLIKKKDGTYSFAPLFDSSTIAMPGMDDNLSRINDYMIDRKGICKYLLNTYPEYINEIFDNDIEKINVYMTELSKDILNEKELEWFTNSVLNKLNPNIFDMIREQRF